MTTAQKDTHFVLSPLWTISMAEKSLFISGGADARYEIELETDAPSFFADIKSNVPFTRQQLHEQDQRVLEQLLTAEIVMPVLTKAEVLRVTVAGDNTELDLPSNKSVKVVQAKQPHDLVLIVRTHSTYAQLLDTLQYQSIKTPHLFVDAAFHHIISVGPLVFPGETACIACLQGRVTTRWGDETPPSTPKVLADYGPLLWALVATELSRIAHSDTSLANKTISWNIQDRTVRHDQLLKVPLCPICTQNVIDTGGALALPWGNA